MARRLKIALFICAVGLVGACQVTVDPGPPSAQVDVKVLPARLVALSTLRDKVAKALCASPTCAPKFANPQNCVAMLVRTNGVFASLGWLDDHMAQWLVGSGAVELAADYADDCLPTETNGCGRSCWRAFRPATPVGAPCASTVQCTNGYCVGGGAGCGQCKPAKALGAACSQFDECGFPVRVCAQGVCRAVANNLAAGTACADDLECGKDLYCVGGTCQVALAPGEPCSHGTECGKTGYCSGDTSVCMAGVALGAACTSVCMDGDAECASDLSPPSCRVLPTVGQSCDAPGNGGCLAPAMCDPATLMCKPPVAEGSPCQQTQGTDWTCAIVEWGQVSLCCGPGLTCNPGTLTCMLPLAAGQSCLYHVQCAAGSNCIGGVCTPDTCGPK